MRDISRRTLLKRAAVGLITLAPFRLAASDGVLPASSTADSVLLNGKIITVDPQDSVAEAIALKDGKVAAVGTNGQVSSFVGKHTRIYDLKGKTATPGLVDSHIHVILYGKEFSEDFLDIRFPKSRTKAELLSLVAERVRITQKGEWISGNQGFNLSPEETPNRFELDAVAPANPVYLRHFSGQYATTNSYALRSAGVDKGTPNPYGGKIEKDPKTGEPTGLLFHYPAENLVGSLAKGYGDRNERQRLDDLLRGQQRCIEAGYTSGQDVIVPPRDMRVYQQAASKKKLAMRLYLLEYLHSEKDCVKLLKTAEKFELSRLRFGGWKIAVDGGPGAATSLMYDTSLKASRRAYVYHDQGTLNRMVTMLHQEGFQVAFHATGDKAVDMAISAVETAQTAMPRSNARHRIEHIHFSTVKPSRV